MVEAMSDSVSDRKVEDVLTSVRRLVSNEVPRNRRRSLDVEKGALVLTDAQRIKKEPSRTSAARSLEERIAELEAAVRDRDDEFEPDGSEDQEVHRPKRIVYTRPPSVAEQVNLRRLSQIAMVETGPASDDAPTGDTEIAFRSGREDDHANADARPEDTLSLGPDVEIDAYVEEAPMAEDVPTEPPRSAEVRAFSDPDGFVDRIEARIEQNERGALNTVEDAPLADEWPASQPVAPSAEMDADQTADDVTSDPSTETTAEFEAALSEAVAASVEDEVGKFPETFRDREPAFAEARVDYVAETAQETPVENVPFAETDEPALKEASHEDDQFDDDEFEDDQTDDDQFDDDLVEAALSEATLEDPDLDDEEPGAEPAAEEPAEDLARAAAAAALAELSNEDAMRLLVRRMMRDEFQGELGERITRNVRKLVRREIKRALEMRDLL